MRSSNAIVASVASRLTDVGIVDSDVSFLDTSCVASFERNNVCAMDRGHPLAQSEIVRLEEFGCYPFVSLGELYLRRYRNGAKLLENTAENTVADTFQSFLAFALVRGVSALAIVDPFIADSHSDLGVIRKEIQLEMPFRISILVNERSMSGTATQKIVEAITALLQPDLHNPDRSSLR